MNNPNAPADPINLSPEDCEQILQRSTSQPSGVTYPNDSIGYGRLNAGKAMKYVEKPLNKLWHFRTNDNVPFTIIKSFISTDTVKLAERAADLNSPRNYISKGKYVMNMWQVDAIVNHNIPTTDSIKAYWPRPSSSDVWEKVKNGRLLPRERDTILSLNNSQATLRGYIYQIFDTIGNLKGWWPCDTSFSCFYSSYTFGYTVLTKTLTLTPTANKTFESGNGTVKVYPNPALDRQTLTVESTKESNLSVDLFDPTGKLVRRIFMGKTIAGKTTLEVNIADLASSLYIYVIRLDEETLNLKFIKE